MTELSSIKMTNDSNKALSPNVNQKEGVVYTEHLVDSVVQSLLIDAPLYWVLGINPVLGFAGATVGYSIRKYCGEYMGQDSPYKPFVCGAVGGAVKYATKGKTMAAKVLFLGAANNIAYEYFGAEIDKLSKFGQLLSFIGIEEGEGVLESIINVINAVLEYNKDPNFLKTCWVSQLIKPIVADLPVGLVMFGFIEGLYNNFAPSVKSSLMPYAATAESFIAQSYASVTELVGKYEYDVTAYKGEL